VLQRVTIAPGLTESHIRGRIQANTGDFMPERQIADDKNLRRDYERLRIGHELARAVGSELDLDKLLPKILDKAFELVGCDRGVILLMDDHGSCRRGSSRRGAARAIRTSCCRRPCWRR